VDLQGAGIARREGLSRRAGRFLLRGRPGLVEPTNLQRAVFPGRHPATSGRRWRRVPGGYLALGPVDQFLPQLRRAGVVVRTGGIGLRRGPHLRRQVGGQELGANRREQLAVKPAGVLEAHLELGRVNIHVDQLGRHVEPQERDRVAPGHQQPAIGLAQGVLQRAVANETTVEQQILHPVVRPTVGRVGHVAGQSNVAILRGAFDRDQAVGQIAAEELRDPFDPAVRDGQIEYLTVVVAQSEMDLRRGQGDSRKRLTDVAELRLRGPQKLPPHGRVVEQVVDLDRRAHRGRRWRGRPRGRVPSARSAAPCALGRAAAGAWSREPPAGRCGPTRR